MFQQSGMSISLRTVRRMLQANEYMTYGHLKVRPSQTPVHVKARKKWAPKYAFETAKIWKRVMFSDKKRFGLDSSDGDACFWREKRFPRDTFSRLQRGSGGIMV